MTTLTVCGVLSSGVGTRVRLLLVEPWYDLSAAGASVGAHRRRAADGLYRARPLLPLGASGHSI